MAEMIAYTYRTFLFGDTGNNTQNTRDHNLKKRKKLVQFLRFASWIKDTIQKERKPKVTMDIYKH